LIDLQRKGHLRDGDLETFERERDRIRHAIENESWNPELGSYVSEAGGTDVDAGLLLIPWYGFEPADSPRMRSTFRRIRERLGAGRSLLYRYRTGDSPGEGAFGIASFWGVEYLALGGGTLEEAESAFEELLAFANDVGLFAEEIDPITGAALGNFPQGFTHVGLLNAAVTLEKRRRGEPLVKRGISRRPEETESRKAR
jgi:GH15 family glucan-1,4-alpha-glucosidase